MSRMRLSAKTRYRSSGTCERTGKLAFPTDRDAVKYAAWLKQRMTLPGGHLRDVVADQPYRCPHCQQWHLTSQRARGG